MSDNQQDSLFTELTDREAATVSGASITGGIGIINGAGSNNDDTDRIDGGNQIIFMLPNSGKFFIYDPTRSRSFKTIVI
ncbi:MAG: secretion protein HlyD [Oscillatoriaceae cyanobacterium Prado104]|jgi:hypothetical protein|nr:secretion protein HlyD [Oscillatoriaceae cyanobacterium Prado104]